MTTYSYFAQGVSWAIDVVKGEGEDDDDSGDNDGEERGWDGEERGVRNGEDGEVDVADSSETGN